MVKLLALYPIGRILFWISIELKSYLFYLVNEVRAIEYPWVVENLRFVPRGDLILDVGCAESLLSHELIARGFRVVGIDIQDYPFKDKRMIFLKRNIMDNHLPDNIFDAIVMVSTIEHIGLRSNGQTVEDTNGDLRTMNELARILKHQRIIILTTPTSEKNPYE